MKLNIKKLAVIMSILIISFSLLTVLAKNGGLASFENDVYTALARYINPTLTNIMIVITNCGSTCAIIAIILVLLALPFTRTRLGVPVAVNAVLSSVLNHVLKVLVARDRPDILCLVAETGYGFPSGHAMNNAALYVIVIFSVFRETKNLKVRIPILICGVTASFLIGVSRIYLGVHNAGDILAGWIMGVAVALLADTAYATLLQKRQRALEIQCEKE